MRITIDARLYGLEHAGLGRYTINLIENLLKLDKKNKYSLLLRKKYFSWLNLPENCEKVLADFRHYSLSEQIKLPKIISKTNPDLVHFLHFNVPKFYKNPYVVTIHDILMHSQAGKKATTLPLPFYLAKRMGYKYVFREAVFNSKRIIVPSRFIKKELTRYYKLQEDKIDVIYEGFDEKILLNVSSEKVLAKYGLKDKNYFIYTGNAYPHKNLDRAIEATVLLNKSAQKRTFFVIVSSRDYFVRKLQAVVDNLNAGEYVKLLGFVPDSHLGVLYKNSQGFLYPTLSEGFGLPALEAMAAGSLALVSDIPVFREVYKDSVIYFNPMDFSSIEQAMGDVLEMEQKTRDERISAGKEYISRFSWEKAAKETLKTYREAAGKS